MASDSQTATATTCEKPMENKLNEEASLMEKEIVLTETADVVKDKPVSNSNLTVEKEKKINQTPAGEPEKELHANLVEEVASVVKADESTDKGKGENGEEKVVEQVELKEQTLVKESVAEVNVQEVDVEKAEGKGKDENGEEKVAEQVELKETTLVEKLEEKQALESVAEEDNKDKEEEKMVDVSESTDEAGGQQVEPDDVQLVREVSVGEDKIKDVEVLEVEPKPETSEKVEAQAEKAKEFVPEVEVVKTEETPETTEQAKVELVDSIVETKDSGINSKDEQISESDSALCPEENVPINQDSETAPKKESEGDASSLPDVIERAITEEKQVVEEPSKDEKENVSEEAKDVVTKLATEDDNNITKDTETHTAEGKSGETLKETDKESTEGNKQEESTTEKVAEVVETTTVAEESNEPKQQPEVTAKEVKHSRSIMSKVKQSLVKAKKAIIGKSPSSKTITTEEAKEETKGK